MAQEQLGRVPRMPNRPGVLLCAVGIGLVLTSCGTPDGSDQAARGAKLFEAEFTPEQGLGPVFNDTSCAGCHFEPEIGGMGRHGLETVVRVGRLTEAGFDPMIGEGGPFGHARAISALGVACEIPSGIPAGANLTSVRNTPSLFGSGLIDAIPDQAIRANAGSKRDGVSGEANLVRVRDGSERVGRFGWKGDVATLEQFVADALRNELGVTSDLAPASVNRSSADCPGQGDTDEIDGEEIAALSAFVRELPPPEAKRPSRAGARVFTDAGCAACHLPALPAGRQKAALYSDLLLHDMGASLDDRVVQGAADGGEWRTTPLWGLGERRRFLHDGRAESIRAAVLAHGGEAEAARRRFLSLSPGKRNSLMEFLRTR